MSNSNGITTVPISAVFKNTRLQGKNNNKKSTTVKLLSSSTTTTKHLLTDAENIDEVH